MDTEITTLSDYIHIHKEFKKSVTKIIEAIENTIKQNDKFSDDKTVVQKEESSIIIDFCGFQIKFSLIIKATEDLGYFRCYYIRFNEEEQKHQGELVCEYYFDHIGNIFKDKSKQAILFSARFGFDKSFSNTLLAICKTIESEKMN